jgi:hypothetical protein
LLFGGHLVQKVLPDGLKWFAGHMLQTPESMKSPAVQLQTFDAGMDVEFAGHGWQVVDPIRLNVFSGHALQLISDQYFPA